MKKIFLLIIILTPLYFVFSDETEFVNSLFEKKTATFSDLVSAFCYLNDINAVTDFNSNINFLKEKIKYFPKKYSEQKPLNYGDFSLFFIQQIKLKSGLLYQASHSGRYALRELMIIKVIPENTSEFNKMSGNDLLRYLGKVDLYEVQK